MAILHMQNKSLVKLTCLKRILSEIQSGVGKNLFVNKPARLVSRRTRMCA